VRLLRAARLSRVVGGAETGIDSSDLLVQDWARRAGHVIVHTDPEKIAQYDGIVACPFDRLSRVASAAPTRSRSGRTGTASG
jgi:hypothetical protein